MGKGEGGEEPRSPPPLRTVAGAGSRYQKVTGISRTGFHLHGRLRFAFPPELRVDFGAVATEKKFSPSGLGEFWRCLLCSLGVFFNHFSVLQLRKRRRKKKKKEKLCLILL